MTVVTARPQNNVVDLGVDVEDFVRIGLRAEPHDLYHHQPGPDGVWRYGASGISSCVRKHVLQRAGFANDESAVIDELPREVGTAMHERFERWIRANCAVHGWQMYAQEEWYRQGDGTMVQHPNGGFFHPTLPLQSRPDAITYHPQQDRFVVWDFKSEKEGAVEHRRAEARAKGMPHSAKHAHVLQLVANAINAEANGLTGQRMIEQGKLLYFTKNGGWSSFEDIDISSPQLRAEAITLIRNLEEAWQRYAAEGIQALPPRLNPADRDKAWECAAQKKRPTLGRWCPARSVCMDRRLP